MEVEFAGMLMADRQILKDILQELKEIKSLLKASHEHNHSYREEAEKARQQSENMKLALVEQFKKLNPQMGEMMEKMMGGIHGH